MSYEQLKLHNQLCFPLYAASRLVTREYQPFLDKLGITYPQYLVLLVLWESDRQSVNEISQKLILNTNTVTPLLKRMETQGLISRIRSEKDERKVEIALTEKGKELESEASAIPGKLAEGLMTSTMNREELTDLKTKLHLLIDFLNPKEE